MEDKTRPIEVKVRPALGGEEQEIGIFTSYSFDRSVLVPAAAFRFTAEGVDQEQRLAIRSGDMATLYARNRVGKILKLSTGFIDETDTHITPQSVSYLLTGRDTAGQLVDNAAVDANNAMIFGGTGLFNITQIAQRLVQNTRMPQQVIARNAPNAAMLLQTNSGETKISVLQRYLEITNCLAWTEVDGRIIVGKPNMAQSPAGVLVMSKDPNKRQFNNILEVRVKRAPAMAIRQIAYQLQDLAQVGIVPATKQNMDKDVARIAPALAGRSVYRSYSIGMGTQAYDNLSAIGQGGGVSSMGDALAMRELAMDNLKALEVEAVMKGHINDAGNAYDVDQVYEVIVDDEALALPMYVYAVRHDYTRERGPITTLKLCKLGALVWGVPARA